MNSFGIQDAQVWKVCANFFCVWTLQELVEKKTKFVSEKTCKKYTILVFLRELLACHLITKFCTCLVHPSILDAKKFHMFLNFLAIFLNLLFKDVQIYCFPLPRAPGMSKQHEKIYAPCAHEQLQSHKISEFFDFFAIFRDGQSCLTGR